MDIAKKSEAGQAASGHDVMLHGKAPMENKASGVTNAADPDGEMAKEVREAAVLHYHEGNDVAAQTSAFKAANKEWVDHSEVDELYPTHKD